MSEQEHITEEWRPIPQCEGYDASNLGRVRSWRVSSSAGGGTTRRLMPKMLGGHVRPRDGYREYTIRYPDGSGGRCRLGQHLVLFAFVGPQPAGRECCHKNADRLDNRLSNLRWDTRRANYDDRQRDHVARGTGRFKLLEVDVLAICNRLHEGWPDREIAEVFGCSHQAVQQIRLGYIWAHVPRPWGQRPLLRGPGNKKRWGRKR